MAEFAELEKMRDQVESQLESRDEVAGVQLVTFHGRIQGLVDAYADEVSNLDAYADELDSLDEKLKLTNAVLPRSQEKLSNPFGAVSERDEYERTVYRYEVVCSK